MWSATSVIWCGFAPITATKIVFLYRLRTSPEVARRLFLVYLERINELADHPEFYHLFSNSCTINIVRYANLAGRVGRLDIRHILNGWSDRYLYDAGVLDTSLPFEELRRRSHINEAAQAAGNTKDFSERIRKSLPTPPADLSFHGFRPPQIPFGSEALPYWTKVQYTGAKILRWVHQGPWIIHFSGPISLRDLEERNQGNPDSDH